MGATQKASRALLLDALRELEPSTLLLIAPQAVPAVDQYVAEKELAPPPRIEAPEELELGRRERFDVGIIAGVVETWPRRASEQAIAVARDQYCETLLLLVRRGAWPLARYLALGFERRAGSPSNGDDLYWYHVDRYNPERDWNNPENWANPENFKRYRW